MASPVTLTDHFVLDAAPSDVLRVLGDVPGVVGCIPGASITADNGDGSYAGGIGVQYGETGVRFAGTVRLVTATASLVTVRAEGKDGIGSVRAEGEIRLTLGAGTGDGTGDRTPVDLAADFTFAGVLAPLARSATKIVGPQLMKSFARCLTAKVAADAARSS